MLLLSATQLTEIATRAALEAAESHGQDEANIQIGLAQIDRQNSTSVTGGIRAETPTYPASICKLFFATYLAEEWWSRLYPELERAGQNMVVESDNDATSYVLDVISATTSGPELDDQQLEEWLEKRRIIDRFFEARGYRDFVLTMKTWTHDFYGRERQAFEKFGVRNKLSPYMAVDLMTQIALGKAVSNPDANAWLTKLLHRLLPIDVAEADNQARLFIGATLPSGSQLYSKAGWTSKVTHDLAWFVLPDGREFVLCIFTQGKPENHALLRSVSQSIVEQLGANS